MTFRMWIVVQSLGEIHPVATGAVPPSADSSLGEIRDLVGHSGGARLRFRDEEGRKRLTAQVEYLNGYSQDASAGSP